MADARSMQAAVLDGPKLPFRIASVLRPTPGPGEVLVRINASGVNPLDTKIRAGQAAHARHPLPAILGIDLAGIVEAVASDVSAFRPGEEVYGMTGGVGGIQGSLAEYAAVGLSLRPTDLLIFGNAKGGTPLMQAVQSIGIDLPLKALVWQDADSATWISYNDPAWLAHRHGLDDSSKAVVTALTGALNAIATKAATP